MLQNGVWRKHDGYATIPRGRKGIGTKWVFKIKKNGTYRSRLVAKGYDQEAGIDFWYNFAPVMSDMTFKTMLALWINMEYDCLALNVQTAFLYGNLEEELFIDLPEGYKIFLKENNEEIGAHKYLKLQKTLYGLVQAGREWWKIFVKMLKDKLGFKQFQNNTCLLKRETKEGLCIMGIYVDDCLMIGDKAAIKKAAEDIKKHFNVTTGNV